MIGLFQDSDTWRHLVSSQTNVRVAKSAWSVATEAVRAAEGRSALVVRVELYKNKRNAHYSMKQCNSAYA